MSNRLVTLPFVKIVFAHIVLQIVHFMLLVYLKWTVVSVMREHLRFPKEPYLPNGLDFYQSLYIKDIR